MSQYGQIYRSEWLNFKGDDIRVDMSPTDVLIADADTPTVFDLQASGNPLTISVGNDSEDKLNPFRPRYATIRIKSTSSIQVSTFAGGPDNGWYVNITNQTTATTIFLGFLVLDDLQQPLLPDAQDIELIASDHLGLLKEIALADADGLNPIGKYTLAQLITMCLNKTGLSLPLRVINNLRIDAKPSDHLYSVIYLDALSGEDKVGLSINCYDWLTMILGEDCVITQYKGQWWIVRIDEYEGNPLYAATFDTTGAFVSFDGAQSFDKSVGSADAQRWVNADTLLRLTRPIGFAKETFNYRYPLELICNQDFIRGDVIDDTLPATKTYELDCWGKFRANYPTSGLIAATTDIYVERTFDPPGYEKDRYVVIEQNAGVVSNLIMSEPVSIGLRDRFQITVNRRLATNQASGSGAYTRTMAQVRLYGDDGTFWTLHGGTTTDAIPRWVATNSTFTTVQQVIQYQGDTSTDTTEVVSKTVDVPDLPVAGDIRVLLYQDPEFGDVTDTIVLPAQLTITPYIGGSYQRFTGQSSTVETTDDGFIANRDNTVTMSDAPRKSMKGAMLDTVIGATLYSESIQFGAPNAFVLPGDLTGDFNIGDYLLITSASNTGIVHITDVIYHVIGNTTEIQVHGLTITTITEAGTLQVITFVLAEDYWASAPFALGPPPDDTYLHPYGYIQAYSVWNQYRRGPNKLQGSVIWSAGDWPDIVHRYAFSDTHSSTVNRQFVLISFSQDWKRNIMTCTFVECYESSEGKIYSDPFTFKYLTGE